MTMENDFSAIENPEWQSFKSQYDSIAPQYKRLAGGVSSALRDLLEENSIPALEISHRIKTADSAFEKIDRKSYKKPFE